MKFNNTTDSDSKATENFAGGEAFKPESIELELSKLVINNLLANTYYEDDTDSLKRLRKAFQVCSEENPEFVLKLAAYAREEMYLRDVSQVLLVEASKHEATQPFVRDYVTDIVQRADEPATCLAINDEFYGKSISKTLQKGLQDAIRQFDEYQFGKYKQENRDINIYDVFNRVHPKPMYPEQADLWERLMKGNLSDYPDIDPIETPKTWETVISEKGNTKGAWESVLDDMGLFARIRNVRNMLSRGLTGEDIFGEVSMDWVRNSKLYPFRFYQSYKAMKEAGLSDTYAEEWLESAIDISSENLPKELHNTVVAVDLSGSMDSSLSRKSDMSYKEIGMLFGAALSKKGAKVVGFGDDTETPFFHADEPTLARMETIKGVDRKVGNSTNGWKVIDELRKAKYNADRVIFFTDMQIWDSSRGFYSTENRSVKEEFVAYRKRVNPETALYMIDLSSYGDLIATEGFDKVYNISGWNTNVIDFINHVEETGVFVKEVENYSPSSN